MPKTKKRGRGAKGDKEKPLLGLQGILKLEKSFVTEQHEGAETVKIQVPGTEEPVEMKLIPGQRILQVIRCQAANGFRM